jgi:hypothetical protein
MPSLLEGVYIPNLVASPFVVNKAYAELIYNRSPSPRLLKVLRKWDDELPLEELGAASDLVTPAISANIGLVWSGSPTCRRRATHCYYYGARQTPWFRSRG